MTTRRVTRQPMRLKDVRQSEAARARVIHKERPDPYYNRPLGRALMLWRDGQWSKQRVDQWYEAGQPMPPLLRKSYQRAAPWR